MKTPRSPNSAFSTFARRLKPNLCAVQRACLFGLTCVVLPAHAEQSALFWLSGTWQSLADYATVGGCAAAPADRDVPFCSPARSSFQAGEHLRASALLSATDIVLEVADKVASNEVREAPIGKLLERYDHAELLADTLVAYDSANLRLGARPYRVSGQFFLHNPNLPLASAALRQDSVAFGGASLGWEGDLARLATGVSVRYLHRKETLIEASLVDLAAKDGNEIVQRENLRGVFGDVGVNGEFFGLAHLSAQVRDLGRFTQGASRAADYLFVFSDTRTRFQGAAALVPSAPFGRFQVGVSHVAFLDAGPKAGDTTFLAFGYFLGPTRFLGSYAPGFLRTALSVTTSGFGLGLAQEWQNTLTSPGGSRPRFTAEMEVRL
ncbi:MAG: hypothetical protein IOD12_17115 [Silvanigrellales bacterium]|nr:hypothetical protein [Silvanigrellales bacterium]